MHIDLMLGDCLEVMGEMQPESVDMVFADPPFNVGKKYKGKPKDDQRDDYYEWCESWIKECFRLLKPTGTLYLMTISKHLERLYPILIGKGVFINQVQWKNSSSARHVRSFWNSYQPILVYGKTKDYKFNRYAQRRDLSTMKLRWGGYSSSPQGQLMDYWDDIPFVYSGSILHKEAILKEGTKSKFHQCQMPIALIERPILFSTDEGDTILEPFMGLGAGAMACKEHNRNYLGIDKYPEYVDKAKWRIDNKHSR